ncbi:MAG: prolipoprotein diacylglyceryl transferase [Candidatus Pacearchaeota archaeon]
MIQFEPLHVLFQIGNFKVFTWGFIFVIGFITALLLTWREAKKQKIQDKHICNLALLILIGATVGPRLFYVFEHFSYFWQKPLEIFMTWRGGITSYGAFLSLLFVWLYTRKQKDITFSQILDIVAPYLLLAIAITRVGCFLNWDDYGIQSSLPWAIQTPNDIARHPTQLYESFYALLLFFILLRFKQIKEQGYETRFKKLLEKRSSMFLFFLLFYSFFRFFNDFLREYEINFLGLALSQWVCLVLFVSSFLMLFSLSREPNYSVK